MVSLTGRKLISPTVHLNVKTYSPDWLQRILTLWYPVSPAPHPQPINQTDKPIVSSSLKHMPLRILARPYFHKCNQFIEWTEIDKAQIENDFFSKYCSLLCSDWFFYSITGSVASIVFWLCRFFFSKVSWLIFRDSKVQPKSKLQFHI